MKAFITIKFALLFSLINGALYAQTNNFEFDFDKYDGSYKTYTNPLLEADFQRGTLTAITNVSVRGTVGKKQLRAFYPKNKILGKDTGFRFEKFMTPSNEAVLEYRVKFEEGFDFAKGGKLPGLAGSETSKGRGIFGCNDDRDKRKKAFSTRLMWRENGRLIYYPYAPLHKDYRNSNNDIPNDAKKNGQGRCGGDLTITTLRTNRWYTIKQYIKLNTFTNGNPNKNGVVKVWIDDVLEFQSNNFVLAGTSRIKANSIAFHTYRGGSTQDWASNKDGYALFDDVKACTGCKNIDSSTNNDNDSGDNTNTTTNEAPVVSITAPQNNATFSVGENIEIKVNASDPDGNFDKVKFYVDDTFIKQDSDAPYTISYTPSTTGTKKIKVEGLDKDGLKTERIVTILVVQANTAPVVNITSPIDGAVYELGQTIELGATATDDNLENINFKINGDFYKFKRESPATAAFNPTVAGTYKIAARAIDSEGLAEEKFVTITVEEPTLSNESFLDNETVDKITMYPNPAVEAIHLSGAKTGTNYQIMDLSGKVMYVGKIENTDAVMDISKYAKGVYFIKLTDGYNSKTRTFLKN